MSIGRPSVTLSLTTSGTTLDDIHSTRVLSGLFPSSTLHDPPPDQSSRHFCSTLSPGPRFSLAVTPSPGRVGPVRLLDVVDPSSEANTSVFSTDTGSIDSTAPTTQTQTTPEASYSSAYSTSPLSSISITSAFSTPSSIPVTTQGSPLTPETTTVVSSTTVVTLDLLSSLPLNFPSTSTYTATSVLPGGATTHFVTSSSILSTQSTGSGVGSAAHLLPGVIAAIVIGIVGAFAFAALWLFCIRKRQSTLSRPLVTSEGHGLEPVDDEVSNVNVLGHGIRRTRGTGSPANPTGPAMEERYADILAALESTDGFGKGNERGSTGGIYGSRHETITDMDGEDDGTRVSSPTLAHHPSNHDDPQYSVPLSPPPHVPPPMYHQSSHPTPPPSAYYMTLCRKSSPGPDAAAWLGGYSVAPSYNSHYARSQTLGSGSRSGSVDALTRTRTGSEEPLLGAVVGKIVPEKSPSPCVSPPGSINLAATTDLGGNRIGLGSAFGSPPGSTYSPSDIPPTVLHDTSESYGARTASGSGSYGYASSGAPSSFDALRRVSSQGALSNMHNHARSPSQGFRFGFNRGSSLSSGSIGKKTSLSNRHSFGVPPTSFRPWKDSGSPTLDKESVNEKHSMTEKVFGKKTKSTSSFSTLGSVEEKQGRGSPVGGVLVLLERLRRAGHTPSPRSSIKELPSPTRASTDADPELGRATPPPIQIQAATPRRPRRFSFVLSNPDPLPPSPYSVAEDVAPTSDGSPRLIQRAPMGDPRDRAPNSFGTELQSRTPRTRGYALVSAPSPAPTEESRLAEGLLHPRLQTQGRSDASLRDFEDYSRPIAGVVKNRLYSTTTFGTQDSEARTLNHATPVPDDEREHDHEMSDVFRASMFRDVPRDSWFFEDLTPSVTALHSPTGS